MYKILIGLLLISSIASAETYIDTTALDCEKWVKEKSDKIVKGCSTFEEKAMELRRHVWEKMDKPKAGDALSVAQLKILKKYYKVYGISRGEKKVLTKEDCNYFWGQTNPPERAMRLFMNTRDKFNFGYGVCDDLASVFMHFARKQAITTHMVQLYVFNEKDEPISPHAIAEALSPDGKWVIIDLDPSYDFEPKKNGKMASLQDIKNDKSILDNAPEGVNKNAYYNGVKNVLNYEKASHSYDNLKTSATKRRLYGK